MAIAIETVGGLWAIVGLIWVICDHIRKQNKQAMEFAAEHPEYTVTLK